MTLLSIVQNTLDLVGIPRPVSVVGNGQQIARQSLVLVNEVVEELGRMNWPMLTIPYTFPTVVGVEQYALPADYLRKVADTAYVATEYYRMRGSLTPSDWQRRRNSLPAAIGRYDSRIYGNPLMLNITPAPDTVETIVFEYITMNVVIGTGPVPKPLFTDDTDTSLFPESLIGKGFRWRIKKEKGFDYAEDFNEYENTREQLFAQQLDLGEMPVAYRTLFDDELYIGYLPESGFGI